MKWYGYVICALFAFIAFYFWNQYKLEKDTTHFLEDEYDHYIQLKDSLDKINSSLVLKIDTLNLKVDSLNKVKQKVKIKYEQVINDFGNAAIVSNDSVIIFISNKVKDWERYTRSVHESREQSDSTNVAGQGQTN